MSDQTHLADPRWNPDQHSFRDFASDDPRDTEDGDAT